MKISYLQGLSLGIAGILLILLAPHAANFVRPDKDMTEAARTFASVLDEKTKIAHGALQEIQKEIRLKGVKNTQYQNIDHFRTLHQKHGISLFVFRDDSLILWSENAIPAMEALRAAIEGREIYHFDNGWHKLYYLTDGADEYVATILIKNTYPYQNQYLDNGFFGEFSQVGLNGIHVRQIPGSVKLRADHQAFYLEYDQQVLTGKANPLVFLLFAVAGGALILLSLFVVIRSSLRKWHPGVILLSTITAVFLLRYFSIVSGWPGYISELELFSPALYASSALFPSLADFIINSLLLVFLSLLIRFDFHRRIEIRVPGLQYLVLIVSGFGIFMYTIWINSLIKGLVINSNIPFDINDIGGLTAYSYLAILSMAMLYFSTYLIAETIVLFTKRSKISRKATLLSSLILILIYIVASHLYAIRDLVFVLWFGLLLLWIIYYRLYRNELGIRLDSVVLVIALFATVGSHNFLKYSIKREHSQRQILTEKLAVGDDPVAELLYSELKQSLTRDAAVRELFSQNELHARQTLEDFILPRYFSGYWSKYSINVYAYSRDSSAWGKLPSVKPMPFSEVLRKVERYGESSKMEPGLFYLTNTQDLTTYIGIVPLHYSLSAKPDGIFVFEISAKPIPQRSGFPALLMDESSRTKQESGQYASARYLNGKLINSRGNFPYQTHPKKFLTVDKESFFLEYGGYEHLITKMTSSTLLVVSRELKTPLDKATTFSYLCGLFGALFALGRLVFLLISHTGPLRLNLNQRIQILLVLLTLTCMLLFAFANKFYIEQKYDEKNRTHLREKMQSVLLEVKNKLDEEDELNFNISDYINRLLSHFSYVFFTDIHLYNPEGDLVASSQMRMFNEGLISRKMNPEAFVRMAYFDQVDFVHEERIGKLNYISAYTPFYNEKGELLAYLNLPYFAKQAELDEEISSFLVSVINIFVLLFILSIIVGLFISQWITSPLRAIRESLAQVDLGKSNRLIHHQSNDEIGLLVSEYNAKVAELEHNAEKLAQSERESAWREMAKQVAHEIKNPLTPMKLSVQHLQRSLDQGQEINTAQINRLASNLVEQIDALSEIASAFSNFARMPMAKPKVIDLVAILSSTVALYESFDRSTFTLNIGVSGSAQVVSDKEQLLRVFNNLIKNALQAIGDKKRGQIDITLLSDAEGYRVSLKDNGSGIQEEDYNRIFVPNFTTKSRGMGLGLAMTKNIVENSNGKIWFESVAGSGSTFHVWLPRA